MPETLQQDIKELGITQGDLVKWMKNVQAVLNELQADHVTFKALTDELHADVDAISAAVDGITAKLDADAGITDTDYEAIHGVGGSGAALPAAAIAAADPAALTESTAVKLTAG